MSDLPSKENSNFVYRAVENVMERFNVRLTTAALANLLAILVGTLTGFGAVVFNSLIEIFQNLFFVHGESVLSFLGQYYVVIIPAIGGIFVGPMIYFFAAEAKGHGVPEVMSAIALEGGRIRSRVAYIKALASSISIGSGGSVGREGPIVQIGASLGSSIGQLLKLRPDLIKGLVACGAAGGISATFNSPLAGIIFSLEVILGNFSSNTFVSLVLSSASANVVARAFYGSASIFEVPNYEFLGAQEIPFYIILGVVVGVIAFLYVKFLYYCEDLADRVPIPEYMLTALGGLIIGSIGVYYPQTFGGGYPPIRQALLGQLPFMIMAILVVMKILSTSITIASGGSGGIFAPSFFIGAMVGGAFSHVVTTIYPGLTTPSGAYSLVAMGALFAGAAQAPITSIIILFEMTDDYSLIVPIMLSCITSYLVYKSLASENIYTMKLARQGVHLHGGRDLNVLQDIMVRDIMGKEVEIVHETMTVDELSDLIKLTDHVGFPVINEYGDLTGIVTVNDFSFIKEGADWKKMRVRDVAKTDLLVTYPDDTLDDVMQKFGMRHVGRLPVVSRTNPKRIIGIVTRTDIVNAYSKYLTLKKSRK